MCLEPCGASENLPFEHQNNFLMLIFQMKVQNHAEQQFPFLIFEEKST